MNRLKKFLDKKALARQETLKNIDKKDPAIILSTWFGCGYAFPAPGFWGTLGTMPLGIALLVMAPKFVLLVVAIVVFLIGLWASGKFEKQAKTHDSSMIVIDESAGILLTLLFASPNSLSVLFAFILFRIFDSVKPWPISVLDKKIHGAFGVMIDDVAAGIAAGICLLLIERYTGIL